MKKLFLLILALAPFFGFGQYAELDSVKVNNHIKVEDAITIGTETIKKMLTIEDSQNNSGSAQIYITGSADGTTNKGVAGLINKNAYNNDLFYFQLYNGALNNRDSSTGLIGAFDNRTSSYLEPMRVNIPDHSLILGARNQMRVGIGKHPAEKLDVNGNVAALEFLGAMEWSYIYNAPSFITTETDPVWTSDKPGYYTSTQVDNLPVSTFTNDVPYLTSYSETDPVWTSDKPGYYTSTQVDNLPVSTFTNDVPYLTSYSETDPVFNTYFDYNVPNLNMKSTVAALNLATGWFPSINVIGNESGGIAGSGVLSLQSKRAASSQNADKLGWIILSGTISGSEQDAAYVRAVAENDWTTAENSVAGLEFYTLKSGEANPSISMHISNEGYVKIPHIPTDANPTNLVTVTASGILKKTDLLTGDTSFFNYTTGKITAKPSVENMEINGRYGSFILNGTDYDYGGFILPTQPTITTRMVTSNPINTNTKLASFQIGGVTTNGGTGLGTNVEIAAYASENWLTNQSLGNILKINTVKTGAVVGTTALEIDGTQNVIITENLNIGSGAVEAGNLSDGSEITVTDENGQALIIANGAAQAYDGNASAFQARDATYGGIAAFYCKGGRAGMSYYSADSASWLELFRIRETEIAEIGNAGLERLDFMASAAHIDPNMSMVYGKTGINTTEPEATLHIHGDSSDLIPLYFDGETIADRIISLDGIKIYDDVAGGVSSVLSLKATYIPVGANTNSQYQGITQNIQIGDDITTTSNNITAVTPNQVKTTINTAYSGEILTWKGVDIVGINNQSTSGTVRDQFGLYITDMDQQSTGLNYGIYSLTKSYISPGLDANEYVRADSVTSSTDNTALIISGAGSGIVRVEDGLRVTGMTAIEGALTAEANMKTEASRGLNYRVITGDIGTAASYPASGDDYIFFESLKISRTASLNNGSIDGQIVTLINRDGTHSVGFSGNIDAGSYSLPAGHTAEILWRNSETTWVLTKVTTN